MFERLEVDPSGEIRGNSHASRHKLTTLAVQNQLAYEDLTDWFARADPRWANSYDHSTNADFRDALSGIGDIFFGNGALGEADE